MLVGGQRHVPVSFNPGKDPVLIAQEAARASGAVWTRAGSLAPPPGFNPRTVQTRSESLYPPSYAGPLVNTILNLDL